MSLAHATRLMALLLGLAPLSAFTGPEAACVDCHGKDGASTESDVPIIGGLSEQYVLDAMAAYRDRQRPCPESAYRAGDTRRPKTDMCRVAGGVAAADVPALAKHLAAEPFVKAKQSFDGARAARGKKLHEQSCEKCHSEGGSLAEDDSGILAGQWTGYLRTALAEFRSGKRPLPEKMKPKFEPLQPDDEEALLHYYASQP
jgi:cytochrome subunit of sulfide dehydrogenase